MKRACLLILALAVLAAPAAVSAQGAARLYGYEKAAFVTGEVVLLPAQQAVEVRSFASRYPGPLTILLARSFDRLGAVAVGELAAGYSGDAVFPLPAGAAGLDTVIVVIPSDAIPVGLGILR